MNPRTSSDLSSPRADGGAPQSAGRAALMAGIVGGVMGALMSGLLNYFVLGLPDTAAANAVNHAMSGLISGFTAGFFGILTYRRTSARLLPDAVVEENAVGGVPDGPGH
ncbi:hypothetical protein [Streptomyces sp. NPDC046909]|uniref:hypothetical protein n=1 Tax=Streptomyces sp. NPDC046909 TaxID=3155617 RepID=UPI0033C8086B